MDRGICNLGLPGIVDLERFIYVGKGCSVVFLQQADPHSKKKCGNIVGCI